MQRSSCSTLLLLLLPVLVQSYSLGNTLPARTRATRCSSVRLAEGKDYMLQELNPAKAGILCVGHPRHPRHPCQALHRCRRPRRPLAAGVADAHSTAQHTQLGHRTRSPLTAHRSPLTAHGSPLTAHGSPAPAAQDPHVGQGGPGLACGRLQAEHRGHRRSHGTAQRNRQGAAGAGCAGQHPHPHPHPSSPTLTLTLTLALTTLRGQHLIHTLSRTRTRTRTRTLTTLRRRASPPSL